MNLEEIKADGRISPEAGLRAYEETGMKPAHDWGHCGIAAVAAACGAKNSEVFEVIGEPYKAGFVDGFDGKTEPVWVHGVLRWLHAINRDRYREGFEDGLTLRQAHRAGLNAEDFRIANLDEVWARARADELTTA